MITKISFIILLIFTFLLGSPLVYAQFILQVPQGGTGAVTLSGCLEGNGTLAITGTGVPCGSGGGGGSSFSTTSALYFTSQGLAFSTTSSDYWKSVNNFYSTTSADYWLTQQNISSFSTTSADYWKSVRNFFSTTSANYWLTENRGNAFSTTSADVWGALKGYLTSYTETDPVVAAINGLVKSNGSTIGVVVSGTDIKTINGSSILGSGDLVVSGGGGASTDKWATSTDTRFIQPNSALGIISTWATSTNATTTALAVLGNADVVGNATSLATITGKRLQTSFSTGYDYTTPLLQVATTTDASGLILTVTGSTSTLAHQNILSGFKRDNGSRVLIGSTDYDNAAPRDHLQVTGRINTESWLNNGCDMPVGNVAVSADGLIGCDGYSFMEDNTGTLTGLAGAGFGYAQLSTATANDGAGVFLNGVSTGWIRFASSTPVMEVNARISNIERATSTSRLYIGFFNINTAGTTFETPPTQGCYFTASSTIPTGNWVAMCHTAAAGANQTIVDTGIASSTVITGTGGFRKFRIEADNAGTRFFIKLTEAGALTQVAYITTNVPTTTAMASGIYQARTAVGTALLFDFFRLRHWWRDFLPVSN